METGLSKAEEKEGPSEEKVAQWASLCFHELRAMTEFFASMAMQNPAGIFIQAQISIILAFIENYMAILGPPISDYPSHAIMRDRLLDYFAMVAPKEL